MRRRLIIFPCRLINHMLNHYDEDELVEEAKKSVDGLEKIGIKDCDMTNVLDFITNILKSDFRNDKSTKLG